MTPRSRTFSEHTPRGMRTRFGSTVGGPNDILECLRSTCSDHTGPGDCADLTINKWAFEGGVIDNDFYSWFGGHFQSYVADVLVNDGAFPHLDMSSFGPSNVEAATSAAARTSPSAPIVDATANALEIFDIAQIIKSAGDTMLKRLARDNLRWQFGILPIVRDLSKLMKFAEHAERRAAVIQKLRDQKSYRRTVDIGAWEQMTSDTIVCQSADAFISVARTGRTRKGMRAHCRWIPSVDLSHLNSNGVRKLAEEAIVNYSVNLSALWEAMPWSWLFDWCGNVGQFLKAHNNTVPAVLHGVQIMTHTKTDWVTDSFSDPSSGNRTMSAIKFDREQKLRQQSFVAPAAHWPFLTANQMGLLASIALK